MIVRTFKYRIYPNATQLRQIDRMFSMGWRIWNDALQQRIDYYRLTGESTTWQEQVKFWHELWYLHPDLQCLHRDMLTALIRRLNKAYQAFFRRIKKGDKGGFPKAKSRGDFTSIEFQYRGKNAKFHSDDTDVARLELYGVPGKIRVHYHRPVPDTFDIKFMVLSHEKNAWYICLQCADTVSQIEPKPVSRPVGLDVGLVYLVALSDGSTISNPRWYRESMKQQRVLQRKIDRQCRSNPRNAGNYNPDGTVKAGAFIWYSSARQKQTKTALRALHRTIARNRLHMWHNITNQLTSTYTDIALEDLGLDFMLKNNDLAVASHDAALGMFYQLLAYKAHERGVRLHFVPAAYTSQTCSVCGFIDKDNRKTQASFVCQACGHTENADINAAKNILARAGFDWRLQDFNLKQNQGIL